VVTHLLSGKVALITSETGSLAAQIRGRVHPALFIAGHDSTSGVRMTGMTPLRGSVEWRRREVQGHLAYALNPPERE
jgi:hypothetical protein